MHFDDDQTEPWITETVLEFATIAGLFAMVFGLFFLVQVVRDIPV